VPKSSTESRAPRLVIAISAASSDSGTWRTTDSETSISSDSAGRPLAASAARTCSAMRPSRSWREVT